MLVVRRRVGQSILLGDGIEIEVLEASANRVKLGIRAPREISVRRKEVELTRQENLLASQYNLERIREAILPLQPSVGED